MRPRRGRERKSPPRPFFLPLRRQRALDDDLDEELPHVVIMLGEEPPQFREHVGAVRQHRLADPLAPNSAAGLA